MLFWTDGLENSTRERNVNFTWNYLKNMTRYLQSRGVECKCTLYDYSPEKLMNEAIHIPYPLGTFKKAEKLKAIIDSLSDEEYVCNVDSDVFVHKSEWDGLFNIITNLDPVTAELFNFREIEPQELYVNFNTGEASLEKNTPCKYLFTPGHSGSFGGFFIARIRAIKEAGNFDPRCKVWGAEDDGLLNNWISKNYRYNRTRDLDITPVHLSHIVDRTNPLYYTEEEYLKTLEYFRMTNTTIVTAVYYSNPLSIMGGRGWNFSYYKPTLYAISCLGTEKVVVYHDKHQEPELIKFIQEYNLKNFELRLVELEQLPRYEKIHLLKQKYVSKFNNDVEELYKNNNRLHILCLSKLWFLLDTIGRDSIQDDPVAWIDAGLFHHALFPETFGGVELARFNIQNYYPTKQTSKINKELGNKLYDLLLSSPKIFGYGTSVVKLPLEWTEEVTSTEKSLNLIGGFFGGTPPTIHKFAEKFYEQLDIILNAGIVPLEEGIMSVIHENNPDLFYLNTFDTWYHDVPTDPCYFLNAENTSRCFYKSFFNLIEERESRTYTSNIQVTPSYKQVESTLHEQYDLPNIAVYGSHNASVAVEYRGIILEVLELERFLNVKNAGYTQYYVAQSRRNLASLILNYFKDKYGFTEYGYCLHQHCETIEGDGRVEYWKEFPAKHHVECKHHESHAAGTFYQSPFQKALIISFDGGGNDGFFKIYLAERGKPLNILREYRTDFGFPYMVFGEYLGDIKKEPALNLGNLVYAGKILGLQSYGNIRSEWVQPILELYKAGITGTNYDEYFTKLGEQISVPFNLQNRLTGQIAYDVAATSQYVFEQLFFEYVNEEINNHKEVPICIAGGCGLNIVLNTKIKTIYGREVFVGPNPNDCGLAVGMLANMVRPQEPIDVTYAGPDLLDKQRFGEYVEKYDGKPIQLNQLATNLMQGQIVGFINGRSEHGPRALGNRSILCSPLVVDMKDTLNKKVKHREWYRPFAPVVRLEDVAEYFEWTGESRWMSFCPKVREKYKNIIPAIVHIDGTARVQTVTREQNEVLYDLLTEFKKLTGIGVLLNTSFNVDGKPILSTLGDAFKVFESTELGGLYVNGFYFYRKMGFL
jgi:carbamoyltransferase